MNDISDLPQHQLDHIKTKLKSTCEKYHNTRTTNKCKNVIAQLSKNDAIIIVKVTENCIQQDPVQESSMEMQKYINF